MEDIGAVAVLAFVGWVLVELVKDLQVMQEEWKERVAKKKQERLKRDLKIIEGRISRGEE
jgi:hypothetical protein